MFLVLLSLCALRATMLFLWIRKFENIVAFAWIVLPVKCITRDNEAETVHEKGTAKSKQQEVRKI